MSYSQVNFRFKFLNSEGKKQGIFPVDGRTEVEGLQLGDETIHFVDIHEVKRYGSRLALVLKPYITLSKELSKFVLPQTTTIVLQIYEGMAFDVKCGIDQLVSRENIKITKLQMEKEGTGEHFRSCRCPSCDSMLDLSMLKETNMVYCDYCEMVFDRFGGVISGTEGHQVCPTCNYYNRLQEYREVHFYAYPKTRKFAMHKNYFCDTCAERMFDETKWKNLPYLIGALPTWYAGYKAKTGRNPTYEELSRANRFAQDLDFEKAKEIYSVLMLHSDGHPGLHYNYALALLQNGKTEAAAKEFQASLAVCSNYKPTLDILKIYTNLQ
ncbi:MAG: hypothetical protein EAZ97_10645 [Bacteroidetes bacterium]|nr:MAG: hypothetical protein EAZ97_10645 [Bacteroidota bacterium]